MKKMKTDGHSWRSGRIAMKVGIYIAGFSIAGPSFGAMSRSPQR